MLDTNYIARLTGRYTYLSMASILSSPLRNLARIGESGMKNL